MKQIKLNQSVYIKKCRSLQVGSPSKSKITWTCNEYIHDTLVFEVNDIRDGKFYVLKYNKNVAVCPLGYVAFLNRKDALNDVSKYAYIIDVMNKFTTKDIICRLSCSQIKRIKSILEENEG